MDDPYAVSTLRYEPAECIDCGFCLEVCPHAVFAQGEGRVVLDRGERCMECGACVINCPTGALTVRAGVGCAWALYLEALVGKPAACCGT